MFDDENFKFNIKLFFFVNFDVNLHLYLSRSSLLPIEKPSLKSVRLFFNLYNKFWSTRLSVIIKLIYSVLGKSISSLLNRSIAQPYSKTI